jgi:hypothetical protein
MKSAQKPNLGNTVHHAIGLIDNLIGLLTFGAYCPYFEWDFLRYRVNKKFKEHQAKEVKP